MKKILEIVDIGSNAEGIAKQDGVVFFVPFALIGELVEVEIVKLNKNIAQCKLLSVLQISPDRVTPKCKYFGMCNGCQLQHCNYEKSLIIKKNIIKNNFKKYLGIDNLDLQIVPSENNYNYRNKISIRVKTDDDKFKIGYIVNGDFLDIDKCKITEENINNTIQILKTFFNKITIKETNINAKTYLHKSPYKYEIIINELNGSQLINILYEKVLELDCDELYKFLIKNNIKCGLFVSKCNVIGNNFIINNTKHINGLIELNDVLCGIKYCIGVNSFNQINSQIKNLLYGEVVNHIDQYDKVLEIYSGAGLMTALISKVCKKVTGVEINAQAAKSANKIVVDNKLNNIENINGDVCEIIKTLKFDAFNVCVIDPPRSGCETEVIDDIRNMNFNKIIYISCNSSTLCRDIKPLIQINNYKVESIKCFDMFPNTKHIESIIVLKKQN